MPVPVPAGDRQAVSAALDIALGERAARGLAGAVAGSIALLAAAGGPGTTVEIDVVAGVAGGDPRIRTVVHTDEAVGDEPLALARALALTVEQRPGRGDGHDLELTFSHEATATTDPSPWPGPLDGGELQVTLARQSRELQRLSAHLADANTRLQQFARIVAHDLKNPLAVIAHGAELLSAVRPEMSETEQQIISAIERAVGQANGIIDDILAYSQAGELLTVPVQLEKLVAELTEATRSEYERAGATVDVPAALPMVVGNPTALRHVLRNLFANALAYRDPARAPVITVTAETTGDQCRIVVADNGIGVPPDQREAIFRPGTRLLASAAPGTGYGLAAVRTLVERHGGRIRADGNSGEPGTRFLIDLPGPGDAPPGS